MKLSEAFDSYLENRIRFGNQSNRTAENHDLCKRSILNFLGDLEIENLTLDDIRRWRDYLAKGRSQNTIRCYAIKLRTVIGYCNDCGISALNVNLIPVPKRDATVPVFLTKEEVAAMIDAATSIRAKFVIALLYSSGIRLSELISLNRGQIYDGCFTVIGKGRKPRLCFIDERASFLMEEYLKRRDDHNPALVVTLAAPHTRATATNLQLLVRNAAQKAGITKHVTPHTLRHSFATDFLRNNGNIRYLSSLLGHSSLDTTMMYAHVVDADLKRQYQKFHTI